MGLFSYVKPGKWVPEEYAEHDEWETKSTFIEPAKQTFRITDDGQLFYIENIYVAVGDEEAPFGFYLKKVTDRTHKIDFTGDFKYYSVVNDKWVEVLVFFENGIAQNFTTTIKEIKIDEEE